MSLVISDPEDMSCIHSEGDQLCRTMGKALKVVQNIR